MSVTHRIVCLLLAPSALTAQASPYRAFKLQVCEAADTVLGSGHQAHKGRIRGYYDTSTDMTHLVAGTSSVPEYPSSVMGTVNYLGRSSFARPALELSVLLAGPMGRQLLVTQTVPTVTLMADDTVEVRINSVKLGRYQGPSGDHVIMPLNLVLYYDAFRTLVTSAKAQLKVNGTSIRWNEATQRDMQALFVGGVCAQSDLPVRGSSAPPNQRLQQTGAAK